MSGEKPQDSTTGDAPFVPPARPLSTDDTILSTSIGHAQDQQNQDAPSMIEMSTTMPSSTSRSREGSDAKEDDIAVLAITASTVTLPETDHDEASAGWTGLASEQQRKFSAKPSDVATLHSSQASISLADSAAPIVSGAQKRSPWSGSGRDDRKPFGFRFRRPKEGDVESKSGDQKEGIVETEEEPAEDLKLMHLRHGPTHAEVDAAYPNDDHPPLSKEELKAFYVYSWAFEPIVVVGMTALIPLILQGLAAGNGRVADDLSKQCDYTQAGYRCVVQVAGAWIDVSSFALYTTAASVLLQAIIFVSLGALADHGFWRKRFMIGFMVASGVFCLAFLLIRSSAWFAFGSFLMVMANISLGASYVFYDAYIPLYARTHWYVTTRTHLTRKARDNAIETVCNAISAYSSILGYLGAIGCFALAGGLSFLITATVPANSTLATSGFSFGNAGVGTYAQQIGVAVTGLWTLIGAYYPYKYMRARPGPPLPKGESYFFYSWKRVWITVKRARKLPNTFLFLVAWFLLSDALTTVGSVTILFAQNELGFTSSEIVPIAIAAPLTAAGGNYLWLKFQQRYRWSTRAMILLLLSLMTALPMYGILGLFAPFGMRHKWELFPAGIYYGCLLGALQSFCRVQFSELLPVGQESEFFALYSITDKGSSWFGPLIVGAITDATHQMRYSFFFLFVMLVLPVFCMWYLDPEKGRHDVEVAREIHDAEIAESSATAAVTV